MIPIIKSIISSDIEDLENYVPDPPDSFNISISLDIGILNEPGEEIFQVSILTPKWLLANYKSDQVFIPRHSLIVLQYDYWQIVREINNICKICSGGDWNECASKLSRYFLWEFEDYKEYIGS